MINIYTNAAAVNAYYKLSARGGKVYVVGGAVRDALLNVASNDIDMLVLGLDEDEILDALPSAFLSGESFGVFRYKVGKHEVEIAMPRTEVSTGPGHKEFEVVVDKKIALTDDLARRDFTVNAMAWDIENQCLIDPYLGDYDCTVGCVDTVFDGAFNDDPLRILRAFVLVARYDMYISTKAQRFMQAAVEGLKSLPAERIQAELDKIFEAPYVDIAISAMYRLGVLHYIFPELADYWEYNQNNPHHQQILGEHQLSTLRHVASISSDKDLRLAALLHDIGKPESEWVDPKTGMNHFYRERFHLSDWTNNYPNIAIPADAMWVPNDVWPPQYFELGHNHEIIGADMVFARLFSELKYPYNRAKRVSQLVEGHMWAPFTSEKGARKFINKYGDLADDLITLRYGDNGGKMAYPATPEHSLEKQKELLAIVRNKKQATKTSDLAINGHDLIQSGMEPGPRMGSILSYLTECVLEHPELNNKTMLLAIAHDVDYETKTGGF